MVSYIDPLLNPISPNHHTSQVKVTVSPVLDWRTIADNSTAGEEVAGVFIIPLGGGRLIALIPSVAEAFLKDTIAIGHALLIAKLPDSQQQEAFNAAFRGMWTTDGNSQVLSHCVLAKVLERVAAPLKKADLLTVAQYTIGHLSYNQVPVLAKRHKVETSKTSKPPQEVLMKKISTYDEAASRGCCSKSACSTRPISAGTYRKTCSWMPPSVSGWMSKK